MQDVPAGKAEREAALLPYRMPARMLVNAGSKAWEVSGIEGFDIPEKASGEEAHAALLYSYSAGASPWFAVGLFWLCTSIPRITSLLEKLEEKRRKREETNKVEKPVQGTSSVTSIGKPA